MLILQINRTDELAIDVELELAYRVVSDPDGLRVPVSVQTVELLFGELVRPSMPNMICSDPSGFNSWHLASRNFIKRLPHR